MAENHFGVWVEDGGNPLQGLAVVGILHVLAQTDVGQAVFREVRRAPFPVTVRPQDGAPGAGPIHLTRQAFRHATQEGKTVHGGLGHALGGTGAGLGTAVKIDFTPWQNLSNLPLDRPDCVLIHEMAHATRYARGKLYAQPLYQFGFETREEVHAGIVANMYRSERNMNRFRIQRVPVVRWAGLSDAMLTFGLAKYLIRAFEQQQPEFFAELSGIDTGFNPIPGALAGA